MRLFPYCKTGGQRLIQYFLKVKSDGRTDRWIGGRPQEVTLWENGAPVQDRCVVGYSEPEFLEALRNYYERETPKNVYPERVSDLVAWRLILRLLRTSCRTFEL